MAQRSKSLAEEKESGMLLANGKRFPSMYHNARYLQKPDEKSPSVQRAMRGWKRTPR